jgi:hypothetical protein
MGARWWRVVSVVPLVTAMGGCGAVNVGAEIASAAPSPPVRVSASASAGTTSPPVTASALEQGATPAPLSATAALAAQALVRDYVAAVNRHDQPAVFALMTAEHAQVVRSASDGLANVVSITDLALQTPRPSGGPGTGAAGYREAVFVPVTFTLHQHQAMSMPDGPTVWGYLLVRNNDTDPWRITDEGPV